MLIYKVRVVFGEYYRSNLSFGEFSEVGETVEDFALRQRDSCGGITVD